jgi:MFS family permease
MDRNIRLAYALALLRFSWFWFGIWIFYYLRFTNYAGIGLIETTMIITLTICEIPTGAIADLLGRKNTLKISYLLQFIGQIIMALAGNFSHLIISVFIISVGSAFYSGTMDAFVYDSLKEKRQEHLFNKVISNITSLQLIAIVVCGLFSGMLYSQNPSLPYYVSGIFYFFGFIICFFLTEPRVDSLKFSLPNFLIQTKTGFVHLFENTNIKHLTILLFSIGGILTIAVEMGDSILSYEYGITYNQMGIFFAFIFLVAAIISQITPKISRNHNEIKTICILSALSAVTFIISPFIGLFIGSFVLVIRQSLTTIFNNISSIVINRRTPSADRATTISSFNMLKNLPYVAGAFYIGHLMDLYSAKMIYLALGLLIIFLISIQAIFFFTKSKTALPASD